MGSGLHDFLGVGVVFRDPMKEGSIYTVVNTFSSLLGQN